MFRDLLDEAYGAMRHNRRRATLTMLGMAWGIATVVLLLAYGSGFGRAINTIFASFGATPTTVSVIGGFCGIIAGHFYYYRDLRLNIFGMLLHIVANAFDNADGQLARLLNQKSRTGRVIDSLFDHLIFLSIYVHLGLRCLAEGASPSIALLVLASGLSHAAQGAAADYFRNAYGRNAGLRIDHLLLSPALAGRLTNAQVDVAVRGWEKTSDHAPVWVELSDGRKPPRRANPRRRESLGRP